MLTDQLSCSEDMEARCPGELGSINELMVKPLAGRSQIVTIQIIPLDKWNALPELNYNTRKKPKRTTQSAKIPLKAWSQSQMFLKLY